MTNYDRIFYAPKVIPVDSAGTYKIRWRIWYWNPHGKSCLMRGHYATEANAQKKLEQLKKEGRV